MPELFTIGHSTHPLQEFLEILEAHQIQHLVDVRTIPKSRRVPWFNKDEFKHTLHKEKIAYTHLKSLGGLRKVNKNSINQGWRNASFRAYADYMQTEDFLQGLDELNELIKKEGKLAIMCAEALPWRCHRSLIGDAELIRGYKVWNIMSKTSMNPHHLTSFAVVEIDNKPPLIYYP